MTRHLWTGWAVLSAAAFLLIADSTACADSPGDTGGTTYATEAPGWQAITDPSTVDAFPRLLSWRPPRRPQAPGGDTLAHFIICELTVDTLGGTHTVRVLGCEGAKEALCDSLLVALRAARFLPARRGGRAVTATVVMGATFSPGGSAVAGLGIPVVGAWRDSLCAWHGRVYGSAELGLANRPYVTRRVAAIHPGSAGDSTSAAVRLKLVVDPDGQPCFILCEAASPSDRGFVEAAVAAARQYRFQPGQKDGQPQAVWVSLDFRWD